MRISAIILRVRTSNSNQNKTVVEFFAGIGLMRAGLEQSGWQIKLANDIDPVKQRLYVNHFVGSGSHFVLIILLTVRLNPNFYSLIIS